MNSQSMNEILRPSGPFNHEFVFLLALITLCVLAYTRRYFGVRLHRHWQAFWNFRLAMQLMREDTVNVLVSFAFGSISVGVLAVALFAGLNYVIELRGAGLSTFSLTAALMVAISATWLRILWIMLLQFISGGMTGLNEYAYCLRVSFLVLGVVLFLPAMCAVFSEPGLTFFFSVLIFLVLLVAQLMTWIRGVQVAIFHNIQLYYLFFYICTLEILPVALIVKYFFT